MRCISPKLRSARTGGEEVKTDMVKPGSCYVGRSGRAAYTIRYVFRVDSPDAVFWQLHDAATGEACESRFSGRGHGSVDNVLAWAGRPATPEECRRIPRDRFYTGRLYPKPIPGDMPPRTGKPATLLAGHPIKYMRKLLRSDDGSGFTLDDATGALALGRATMRGILADLVKAGALVTRGDRWHCTEKGRTLSTKSRGRILRATAEAALDALPARAREINANPDFMYTISALVAFGSVVGNVPRVGDVDVAYSLGDRHERGSEAWDAARHRALDRAPDHEKSTVLRWGEWPEREVERALRGGSTILDLQDMRGIEEIVGSKGFRVIFGEWSPP